MQFGLYLVKQGSITPTQFVEVVEVQLASRPQLGALAIETGKLSVKQVFQVLRVQADNPEKMFGALAHEAGFVSEDDMAGLLDCQARRVRPFVQILVDLGIFTPYEAEELFAKYRSATGTASHTLVAATR